MISPGGWRMRFMVKSSVLLVLSFTSCSSRSVVNSLPYRRKSGKLFLCRNFPERPSFCKDAFVLLRRCMFDSGCEGIGLAVDPALAVSPVLAGDVSCSVADGLSVDPGFGVLPQALNLNARVAMAASVLGDVLLGAMLADGSDPAAPLMSDTAKLPLLIDGSKF